MSWSHIIFQKSSDQNVGAEEAPGSENVPSGEKLRDVLFKEAIDILYSGLSLFTYIYIVALAALYFGRIWDDHQVIAFLVGALSEPYLGAVAVYAILKEYRKKTRFLGSFHRGEIFVGIWVLMLVSAVLLTVFSDKYFIGEPLKIIIIDSIAVMFIYIGGVVHKP